MFVIGSQFLLKVCLGWETSGTWLVFKGGEHLEIRRLQTEGTKKSQKKTMASCPPCCQENYTDASIKSPGVRLLLKEFYFFLPSLGTASQIALLPLLAISLKEQREMAMSAFGFLLISAKCPVSPYPRSSSPSFTWQFKNQIIQGIVLGPRRLQVP